MYLHFRKGKGMRGGENHQYAGDTLVDCPSLAPTGDLARNPGRCPDWESN